MSSEYHQKQLWFLLNKPGFTASAFGYYLPLSHQQLRKYKDVLSWPEISVNEKIAWRIELIEEFQDFLDFGKNRDVPEYFNNNKALPWSIELIEKFRDKWCFESLMQNESVLNNQEIVNHFIKEFSPFLKEEERLRGADKNFDDSILDKKILDSIVSCRKEYGVSSEKEIDELEEISWYALSNNTFLPWSANLIRKYLNYWDWENLSRNKSLPWSFELMKEFENYWCWGGNVVGKDGTTYMTEGLSYNSSIRWDMKLLQHFSHRLDGFNLSYNIGTNWDIDMLIKFKDVLSYPEICFNKKVWENVFPEFHEINKACEVLDALLVKKNLFL